MREKASILAAPEIPEYINVKPNQRARRMALRLDTKTQRFDLTLPDWASLHDAKRFIDLNQGWIEKQQAALPDKCPFINGQIIPVLGINRKIIHVVSDKRRTKITLTDDQLIVKSNLHEQDIPSRIQRYLKKLAQSEMESLVRQKAAIIKKTVEKVEMRDTKSRWGSCSTDGRIMLSWRLILAPYDAMDYVVAHEVAHLQHMDHSPAFWAQCEALSQNYKNGHRWMKQHGQSLMRYGV